MASEFIEKEIEALLELGSDETARKLEMGRNIHVIRITTQESAAAFINGTSKAINKIFGTDPSIYKTIAKEQNNKLTWQNILRNIFRNFKNAGGLKVQEYTKINSIGDLQLDKRSIWLMPTSTEDNFKIQINEKALKANLSKIAAALRAQAWDDWIEVVRQEAITDGVAKELEKDTNKRKGRIAIGNTTHFSHDEQFTVGLARGEEFIEALESSQIDVSFKYQDTTWAIGDYLRSQLGVKYEYLPEFDSEGNLIGERRAIYGTIEQQGAKLDTDWTAAEGKGVRNNILKEIKNYLTKNKPTSMSKKNALDSSGSNSFRQDYRASKTYSEAKKITKKVRGVKKATLKKPKKRNDRKGKVKNSKKLQVRRITNTITLASSIKRAKKRSGESQRDMTPNRLRGLINRRLPAEVRRNMGRPALINQTGRFSNSVKLENLRLGKQSLIGEYTYQLNPYQTFENTGERRWPPGYNPKPLITKSIRNLAAEHISAKFTLRRI